MLQHYKGINAARLHVVMAKSLRKAYAHTWGHSLKNKNKQTTKVGSRVCSATLVALKNASFTSFVFSKNKVGLDPKVRSLANSCFHEAF